MIPEHFKQNIELEINVFGASVKVDYRYWWPEQKAEDPKGPLVCHAEFRCDTKMVSDTGYRSHFFYAELLKYSPHGSLEEFLTELGEHLAKENGYEPPKQTSQLTLF